MLGGLALLAAILFSASAALHAEESQQLRWRSSRVAAVASEPALGRAPLFQNTVLELALNAPANGADSEPAELSRAAAASRPLSRAGLTRSVIRTASLPAGRPLSWRTPGGDESQPVPSSAPGSVPGSSANRPARVRTAALQVSETDEGPVRPVETDPFADPFEDQTVQNEPASPFEDDLPGIESPATEPSEDDLDLGPPRLEPVDEPPPAFGTPSSGEGFDHPLPIPPSRGSRAAQEPCDAVYNERDTCQDATKCAQAWQNFRDRQISQISLDITPGYPLDITNPGQSDSLRHRQLADLESRAWRNRQGETLAHGRMINFDEGRVVVQGNSGMVQIPFRELGDDELAYLNAWWRLPAECRIEGGIYDSYETYAVRPWTEMITFTWKSSALCHKPLYFEDVQLERYGHSRGPIAQPLMSGAHFFLNLAIVPYRMGINPPCECQYALGYYRPGSCAPWMIEAFPISPRGALLQAGVVTGAALIIP